MLEIASNLFESVLFVIFLTLFLKPKREKRVFFCCAFTTAVLLFLNITCSDYFSSFSILTAFFDFLITLVFWKWCLEGSFPQFFMGFGLYWFGISSSAYITVYIFSLIESEGFHRDTPFHHCCWHIMPSLSYIQSKEIIFLVSWYLGLLYRISVQKSRCAFL